MKSILVLETGIIPPNFNHEQTNKRIDEVFLKIKVTSLVLTTCTKLTEIQFPSDPVLWPTEGLRRASINSFGIGGSNTHIILDDALNYLCSRNMHGHHNTIESPNFDPALGSGCPSEDEFDEASKLLVFSTSDKQGVERVLQALEVYFVEKSNTGFRKAYLQSLAYTLGERRTHMPWRAFTVVQKHEDLKSLKTTISVPRLAAARPPRLCFVFTGQGAQWASMGQDLRGYTTFAERLQEADLILRELGSSWSLLG